MIATTLVVAAALAGCPIADAQAPRDFAYRLSIDAPGDAPFHRIDVPAAVYAGAVRGDLGDLRIFNADGTPVPLAFLPPPGEVREPVAPVELALVPLKIDGRTGDLRDFAIDVRRDAGGTSVQLRGADGNAVTGSRVAGYLVDAGEHATPFVALDLALDDAANVETRVRIDGSDDLVRWRALAQHAPVLAVESGGRRIARERVTLAGVPARYLRIAYEPGAATPQFVAARGVIADRVVDAPRQWRDVPGVAAGTPGEFEFDLGGRFPVDRINVALPEVNTVAPARLFARADPGQAWQPAGTIVLYRLRRDGGESVNPPLKVAASGSRYWKLGVDPDAGGIGGAPPTLSAGWAPRSIVFAARGNAPFELAFGSATAHAGALAIDTLVPGYDPRTSPAMFAVASVGAATVAPALAALRAPIDFRRWMLWASLALAAAVLGFMALRLARDLGTARDATTGDAARVAPGDAVARDAPPRESR